MTDQKSKIPDMGEIVSMAGKLFKDVKKSISEIISDYKSSHPNSQTAEKDTNVPNKCDIKPLKTSAKEASCKIKKEEPKAKDTKSDEVQ